MKTQTNSCFPVKVILALFLVLLFACKKTPEPEPVKLEVAAVKVGETALQYAAEITDVPMNQNITLAFTTAVDTMSAKLSIRLKNEDNSTVGGYQYQFQDDQKTVVMVPGQNLSKLRRYTLSIGSELKGAEGQSFAGTTYSFKTTNGVFGLLSASFDGDNFMNVTNLIHGNRNHPVFSFTFSEAIDTASISSKISFTDQPLLVYSYSDDYKTLEITANADLEGYKKYYVTISTSLQAINGYSFEGFSNSFITEVDSSLKFPPISDEELLSLVQEQTFKFFYDYAHPVSGMSRERYSSGDIVTSGGSGFGVMALIVGMERGFISRQEGIMRLEKIVHYLENCDRFHGAWSHWINGSTGTVIPFGTKDNGGDLVETSYMAQGLLTMRQYLQGPDTVGNNLINRINELYNGIEWDWYTRGGQNVLYWHWSPNYGWDMNMQIRGYNETLITYIMAASSTTHGIPASAYHIGYAQNGGILNGDSFYGYELPVGYDYGGPLFFAHYSFLGLDPRNLEDNYANYWTQNVNHSLINWAYCTANPKRYPNYSASCWGLTAGDIPGGYGVSEPTNDRGVITPTAAISSLPYTPEQSMDAIRFFYYILGDKLWGDYGFYDAFDVHAAWWADSYIAIDQGPELIMIENYRTGLLWDLFMSAPEVQNGLLKLNFTTQR